MSNHDHKEYLRVLLRIDFKSFLSKVFETLHPGEEPLGNAWYLDAICDELRKVWSGEHQRSVILVPPRHLKSIAVSVAFTAWVLGRDPTIKIMVATYGEDLSREHAKNTKLVMESSWYKSAFPGTKLAKGSNRALEFHTTKGGCRRAISVEGATTGLGADLVIVDDCMKADDAHSQTKRDSLRRWFDGTLLTRLNNKADARVVSIQQRLHQDDLPAYLIDKGYHVLCLPAIAEKEEQIQIGEGKLHKRGLGDLLNPDREDKAVLDQMRREMGPVAFNSQYQQDPVVPEGNLIRMEWFGSYDEPPERHEFLKVIQSWDTAMTSAPTSDWTVGTTWGFHRESYKWYLLHVFRERLDYPDLKRAITRLSRQWAADYVLIEDAGSGKSLWQEYRTSGELNPIMINPQGNKEERFNGCLAEVEAGHFKLPEETLWLDAFRSELKAFPQGKYDDQVDSFSQFVRWQLSHWRTLLEERTSTGRIRRKNRMKKRPW